MSNKKTHEQFIEELLDRNEYYRSGDFKLLGEYVRRDRSIKLLTKYGDCRMLPYHLLDNRKPGIRAAVDKTDFLKNQIKEIFPDLQLVSEYPSKGRYVLVLDSFGVLRTKTSNLLNRKRPSIESALDKNAYFINQAKEKHGDKYDYSLVEYKNARTKVKIICPQHGVFYQAPYVHLRPSQCNACSKEVGYGSWKALSWTKRAENSINFDSYKVYILKCWNDNEDFYKIGRTFRELKERFKYKKDMPYNYKIISEITSKSDAEKIVLLEKLLLDINNKFKYIPKIRFGGMQECFKKLKYDF